jgi:hypothetical protein
MGYRLDPAGAGKIRAGKHAFMFSPPYKPATPTNTPLLCKFRTEARRPKNPRSPRKSRVTFDVTPLHVSGNSMDLTPTELISLIARVRRDQPRNAPVMALCDELERRLIPKKPKLSRAEIQRNYRNRKKQT